VLAKT